MDAELLEPVLDYLDSRYRTYSDSHFLTGTSSLLNLKCTESFVKERVELYVDKTARVLTLPLTFLRLSSPLKSTSTCELCEYGKEDVNFVNR